MSFRCFRTLRGEKRYLYLETKRQPGWHEFLSPKYVTQFPTETEAKRQAFHTYTDWEIECDPEDRERFDALVLRLRAMVQAEGFGVSVGEAEEALTRLLDRASIIPPT